MAFMGETVDIGVGELLSVLAQRGHDGRLSITADGDEVQIYLAGGKIILVSSSNHALRLGRVLVRLGVLDAARLDAAVREQDRNGRGRPLGRILIENGWATEADLTHGAEEQCIEALARVIVATHGTFVFARDLRPATRNGLVSLKTDSIVLEASRRADEMMALSVVLPAPASRLALSRASQPLVGTLTAGERQVIEALRNEAATLSELTRRVALEEVVLWRTVVTLRERGILVTHGAGYEDEPAIELDVIPTRPTRTIDELVALGAAGDRAGISRIPSLAEIRAGTPASGATIAAVTGVARDVVADLNAGQALRAFANFSDDHFRRNGPLSPEEIAQLHAPTTPLPAEEQETFVALRDVRALPDGRVSAILITRVPGVGDSKKVLILAQLAGEWRIDGTIEAPATSTQLLPVLQPVDQQPLARHAS